MITAKFRIVIICTGGARFCDQEGTAGLEWVSAGLEENWQCFTFCFGSWLPECLLYKYPCTMNLYVQCFVRLLCFPADNSFTLKPYCDIIMLPSSWKKLKSLTGLWLAKSWSLCSHWQWECQLAWVLWKTAQPHSCNVDAYEKRKMRL